MSSAKTPSGESIVQKGPAPFPKPLPHFIQQTFPGHYDGPGREWTNDTCAQTVGECGRENRLLRGSSVRAQYRDMLRTEDAGLRGRDSKLEAGVH